MSCFVTGWTFLSWCHHVQLWRGLELDRTSEEGWECTPDSTQTGWGENMRLLCNVKSACCWLSAHLFKWQVYCYFLDECSSFCKTKVDLSLFTSQLDLLCNVHTYILMRYIQWTGLNLFWYMLDKWMNFIIAGIFVEADFTGGQNCWCWGERKEPRVLWLCDRSSTDRGTSKLTVDCQISLWVKINLLFKGLYDRKSGHLVQYSTG